jgi:hypothetical protein
LGNGKTVCPECHTWIHSHPIEAEAAGLLSSETYEKAMKAIVDETIEGREVAASMKLTTTINDLAEFEKQEVQP